MSKKVYISADYDNDSGDRNVVDELNKWGTDNYHKVDFVDMAKVVSGSVSNNSDCCICDLKAEFNRQINASSAAIFVLEIRQEIEQQALLAKEFIKNGTNAYVLHINKIQMA